MNGWKIHYTQQIVAMVETLKMRKLLYLHQFSGNNAEESEEVVSKRSICFMKATKRIIMCITCTVRSFQRTVKEKIWLTFICWHDSKIQAFLYGISRTKQGSLYV